MIGYFHGLAKPILKEDTGKIKSVFAFRPTWPPGLYPGPPGVLRHRKSPRSIRNVMRLAQAPRKTRRPALRSFVGNKFERKKRDEEKILSLALALAVCLGLTPSAFAENGSVNTYQADGYAITNMYSIDDEWDGFGPGCPVLFR